MEKHRDQAHLTCGTCSEGHCFELTRIEQMDAIAGKLIECVIQLPEWQAHRARVTFVVTMIIHETCMNAIEHGALGIDKVQKRKIMDEKGDQYLDWVKKEWSANHPPLSITACINNHRLLIGVHDSGTGFDTVKSELVTVSDAELTELSGRGMAILKGMGVKLRWNKEGNTILCSFRHSAA